MKNKCQYCKDNIKGDRISIFGFGSGTARYVDWGCFLLMGKKGLLILSNGRLIYKHR